MFRTLIAATVLSLLITPASARTFGEMFPDFPEALPGMTKAQTDEVRDYLGTYDYQQGDIQLTGGFAELRVPEGFYFLGPEDAERVLTEIWGNPPDPELPLGMVLPSDLTPIDPKGWGVTITWDPMGYVSDADANDIDYDELLAGMQADIAGGNPWRVENGYPPIELVGWAAPPNYDSNGRRLFWAQELKFGDQEVNTLNYEMRILGRKGVLVMTFIAGMDALEDVQAAVPAVLSLARFKEGSRYLDFDASIDEVAAVGIGGLIAGKVLAKTGLLAMALLLVKKFWFLGLLALGGLWRLITSRR